MFKVTFEVSASGLERLLAAAGEQGINNQRIDYEDTPRMAKESKPATKQKRKVKKQKRVKQADTDLMIVSLSGKKAVAGSMREGCLIALEKLEAEHGIGTITRGTLRKRVEDLGLGRQVIYQLLKTGHISQNVVAQNTD